MIKKLSNVWAVSLFVFIAILLPFYLPKDGYAFIGEAKFNFFLHGMTVFIPAGILLFIFTILKHRPSLKLSLSDTFALLYLLVAGLSYSFAVNNGVALFGNEEWNMGLITQICLVFLYFAFSGCKVPTKPLIYAVCLSGNLMAVLTILNVFGIYPIPIKGLHPLYVSTIGNINWFCGYFIILVGMELALYFFAVNRRAKIVWGITLLLSLTALIVQSSMSGYVALFIMLLILLKPALSGLTEFLTYTEIYLLLFGGCTLMYMTGYFVPNAYTIYDPLVNIVAFSPLPFLCLFLSVTFYMLIRFCDREVRLSFLYKYVVLLVVVLFILYLALCLINTLMPSLTPFLNGNGLFTLNRFWWSTRGGTYTIGVQAFFSLPWYRWFIGVGPDCFLTYVYENLDKVTMAKCFKIQPLANAHNEFLTILVNFGICGVACYAGLFINSIKNTLKSANPFMKIILFGIVGYITNNMFSFSQILNTPFVFVLLGILENTRRQSFRQ